MTEELTNNVNTNINAFKSFAFHKIIIDKINNIATTINKGPDPSVVNISLLYLNILFFYSKICRNKIKC